MVYALQLDRHDYSVRLVYTSMIFSIYIYIYYICIYIYENHFPLCSTSVFSHFYFCEEGFGVRGLGV